jgi:ribosomal-protein-alanine N-acetyltransferase
VHRVEGLHRSQRDARPRTIPVSNLLEGHRLNLPAPDPNGAAIGLQTDAPEPVPDRRAAQRSPGAPAAAMRVPMAVADLDAVMALESSVYPFPWTRGNFVDSLAAGYFAHLLRAAGDRRLVGYCVAMLGAGEMHLLNITVAPAYQRLGHARRLLAGLIDECRRAGAACLWLEVRESNAGAREAYARLGFRSMGVRPGYYPAAHGQRESAVVMSLDIGTPERPGGALD